MVGGVTSTRTMRLAVAAGAVRVAVSVYVPVVRFRSSTRSGEGPDPLRVVPDRVQLIFPARVLRTV